MRAMTWAVMAAAMLVAAPLSAIPARAYEKSLPSGGTVTLPGAPKPTDKMRGDGEVDGGSLNLRTSVDQNELPWSAVGRLMAGSYSSCTASLIGPTRLLTAAHCVFDPRTQRPFPPQALHFMLGYSQGRYVAQARGIGLMYAETYDPTRGTGTAGDDWAIVELDQALGTPGRALALRDTPPATGEVVTLGGYAKERIEVLMVDHQCQVLGYAKDKNGTPYIHHNCTANHGVSGAPLLIQDGASWLVVGIEAVGTSANDGGAATLDGVRTALQRDVR